MRNVTLLSYWNGNSALHRLHPLTKLVAFLCFAVLLFFENNILSLVFSTGILFLCILCFRIPPALALRNRKWIIIACAVSFLTVLTEGKTWVLALLPALRLTDLLIASSLLTLTTKTADTAYAAGMVIPSRDFTMMVSIALSFVPVLGEEAARIADAQKSRGALVSGSLRRRAYTAVSIVIPLFASAVRRASGLADTMTSRAYGSTARPTRMNKPVFSGLDFIALLLGIAYVLCIVYSEVFRGA